jgi:ribosomal-protein-alanine N-acetyltransferase
VSAQYEIVPMAAPHLDEIMAIELESYENPWARSAFESELGRNPVSWSRVALTNDAAGRVAGYCIVWIVFEHVHIQNLAIHPEHRRQGLARLLLQRALEAGRSRGAAAALLEVRRSNEAAQKLYRSLGFIETGTRRDYYSRPREDALLFRKELGDAPGGA